MGRTIVQMLRFWGLAAVSSAVLVFFAARIGDPHAPDEDVGFSAAFLLFASAFAFLPQAIAWPFALRRAGGERMTIPVALGAVAGLVAVLWLGPDAGPIFERLMFVAGGAVGGWLSWRLVRPSNATPAA